MNNGIQFMGDGPVMQGTWYNPHTGHKFTVRDCFFQDGQFMVQTTNGQMLDYNTVQNYIQATDEHGKEVNDRPLVESSSKKDALPPEVAALVGETSAETSAETQFMLPEDEAIINGESPKSKMVNATGYIPDQRYIKVTDPDMPMVERVLRRFNNPDVEVKIDSRKFPKKQIETLVDILGIDPQTIAEYYINKLDLSEIHNQVKDKFVEEINKIIDGEPAMEKSTVKKPVKKTGAKKCK